MGLFPDEGTTAQVVQPFTYNGAGTYEFGAYFSFVSYGDPPTSWPKDRAGVTCSYDTGSGWLHPNEIWSIGSNLSWTQHPSGANMYRSDWYLISDTFDLPSGLTSTSGEFYLYLQRYAGITAVNIDDAYVRKVPEPATMLLLGTSLFGLAVIRRKKFLKK